MEVFIKDVLLKIPNAVIVEKKDALKKTYEKTIIIDIPGNRTIERDALARQLVILTSLIPDGEVIPQGVEYLIIVGSDSISRLP